MKKLLVRLFHVDAVVSVVRFFRLISLIVFCQRMIVMMVAPVVRADTFGYANNNQDFYVFINDMVDFDQARDAAPGILGLPEDDNGVGGGMYCVPTSSSDLIAYIQEHGYIADPAVTGPGVPNTNWQDPAVYNFATLYIAAMGADMDTDPAGGTNSSTKIFQAVRDRLSVSEFDVTSYLRTNTWSPKSINIASYMFNGGIVQFAYGRWKIGGAEDTPFERTGGHAIVMTKVDKREFIEFAEDESSISFANPGGSSANPRTTQSNFVNQVEDCVDFNYFNEDPGVFRLMTRILFTISDIADKRHRIIDSALAIYPKQGFFESPDDDNVLDLFGGSFDNGGGGVNPPKEFARLARYPLPDSLPPLVGAMVSPDRGFAAFLATADPTTGAPGVLYHLDLMTGMSTAVTNIEGIPTGLTFHRDRTCFVSSTTKVIRLEMDQYLPRGQERLSWEAATSGDAIAFDDSTDQLLVVSLSTKIVDRYNDELNTVVSRSPLPATLDVGTMVRSASFNLDKLLIVGDVRAYVLSLEPDGNLVETGKFEASTGSVSALEGGSLGDDGHIFLVVDGVVQELEINDRGTAEPAASPSPFSGLPARRFFDISRSRTNIMEDLHSGPEWQNIAVDELPIPTREEICIDLGEGEERCDQVSSEPSSLPSSIPSSSPSFAPNEPSSLPSSVPTSSPRFVPSEPSFAPSSQPSSSPSSAPSATPSSGPSALCESTCNLFTWILQVTLGWNVGWLFGFKFCAIC